MRKALIKPLALLLALTGALASPPDRASPEQLQAIRKYIKDGWRNLTRSNVRLAQAAIDPKFPPAGGGRWPVYVSSDEDIGRVEASLRVAMPSADFASVELRRLPVNAIEVNEQGLLYL